MLIIEGLTDFGQRFVRMFDYRPSKPGVESRDYSPERILNDIDEYHYKAYPCHQNTLQELINNLEEDKRKVHTDTSLGSCYFWAIQKLIDVGLERPDAHPGRIVIPSLVLRGKKYVCPEFNYRANDYLYRRGANSM